MPRKLNREQPSGRVICLVDDDADYLAATQRLLERDGHQVLAAGSGREALDLLRRHEVDLLLLDYYMPGMNGEAVVSELRQFNHRLQVILQTGYATEQPPRELMRRFDIQGYFDKGDGPEKLLLWTDVGLKAAATLHLIEKSRQGLRYILDTTPDLHKIQPLDDLLHGLLFQLSGVIGVDQPEGFVAMLDDSARLLVRAGTGPFVPGLDLGACLEGEKCQRVYAALQAGQVQMGESCTVVPLQMGHTMLGVIFVDRAVGLASDVELLDLFANQAAAAIYNLQLYAIATLDPLTGAYVRRFMEIWLVRELRTAYRSQKYLAVIMADLDGLKRINDTAGHLTGDQALALVGRVLRQATRGSDIVGRYGGDEFVVVLPETDTPGALKVGQRILDLLQDKTVAGPAGPLPVRCSVGLVVLEPPHLGPSGLAQPLTKTYFQNMAQLVIRKADEALYRSKQMPGGAPVAAAPAAWLPAADTAADQSLPDPA